MRRAPALLLAASALTLAACTGDGKDATTPSTEAPTTAAGGLTTGSTEATTDATAVAATTVDAPGELAPAPSGVLAQPSGVRTYGAGRARAASYDPASDRTVVATTLAVVSLDGDGVPTTLVAAAADQLAASPDGSRVGVLVPGGVLRVWDVASGSTVAERTVADVTDRTALHLAGQDTAVLADGARATVVSLTDDATEVLADAARDGGPLGTVAVGTGGTVAVPVAAATPGVVVWTPGGTRTTVDPGFGAGGRLSGVMPSPDGSHLAIVGATATGGDELRIWDVAGGRVVGTPVALANFVTSEQLAFPSADRVVVPLIDRVAAFDLTGTEVASTPAPESPVVTVQEAGAAVLVTSADGTAVRWQPGAAPTPLAEATTGLVDERADGGITTVDQRGLVRSYAADGTLRHEQERYAVGEVTSVAATEDGATFALATSNGAVRLVDAESGATVAAFDRSQGAVTDVALSPDDAVVVTGVAVQKRAEAWDDTIEATEVDDDAALFELGGQSEDVAGCAFYEGRVRFSPDGTLVASTSHDFTVQVTPLDDPAETTILPAHLGTVYDLQFSPDGRTLVTSADDGSLRVWQVDGWELLAEHRGEVGAFTSLAFAPDGTLAASAATGEISIVDPMTGTVVRTFDGNRAVLGSMTFGPDGTQLFAPLDDGGVGVWDVAGGAMVEELQGHTEPVTAVVVTPDGRELLSSSRDGTVRAWPLPTA